MCKGATVPSRMRPVNHQKPIHASDPFTDGRKNDYFESSIIAKIIWILMRRPETGDGSAISHQPEPTYYPLHVVTEMANLVTDIQFLDINPLLSSSSKGGGNHKNNKSVSPVSSVHDLYAMQTSRRRFTYDLSLLSTWRQQMYSWTRTVVRGLHLDRDTAAVAFSTLDRFLTIKLRDNDEISRENFQLYCMLHGITLCFSENGCIDPKTKIDECGQNFVRVVSSGTNYGCRARDPQSIAMACKSTDGHGILRIVFALVCLRSAS